MNNIKVYLIENKLLNHLILLLLILL